MSAQALSEFRYDPFSDAAMRDPQTFYRVMREEHPAYYIAEYDTWVFTRFEDVWNGYMEGAVRSGESTADEVARLL